MDGHENRTKRRIIDALVTVELVRDIALSGASVPLQPSPQLVDARMTTVNAGEVDTRTTELVDQVADELERGNERKRSAIQRAPDLTPLTVEDPLARQRAIDSRKAPTQPKRSR